MEPGYWSWVLPEIRSYLTARGIGSVYLGEHPTTPDGCVALYEERGDPPVITGTTVQWECPAVLVLVRDATYAAAEARAHATYVHLRRVANVLIEDCFYRSISAASPPHSQGRDELNRPVFAFMLKVQKALSPCLWT